MPVCHIAVCCFVAFPFYVICLFVRFDAGVAGFVNVNWSNSLRLIHIVYYISCHRPAGLPGAALWLTWGKAGRHVPCVVAVALSVSFLQF